MLSISGNENEKGNCTMFMRLFEKNENRKKGLRLNLGAFRTDID